ncbi:chaperonin complex component, TCP-1 delta subunit, putative [Ixodes scapularis]|uniref:Chaperonin complex component, TCP-1 delta subunit, putative n=1 Tax=Ixodes scapularis TaxID=6945 RepID=B7PZ24_IXOSC|nr:chaperonin complex component, TCP-1 delta subunit, putative [Ixodes scapularis]|eukprot:XP_002404469.1 chaperonin complex component, TCP-1 delta subunit, putative [Ixodes scapularis]
MAAVLTLNPKAEVARHAQALAVNINAARGLQNVLRTNLGPTGTMKMLQIQLPTANLIARASTAQNDITGDGTTSTVLIIGELLKQADLYVSEGLHPRILAEGFELAQAKALEVLESLKVAAPSTPDRDLLVRVAHTALATKVNPELAQHLTEVCVDAVLAIRRPEQQLNLHMVEIMEMQHKTDMDTQLVRGLVLDHGARHPDMKKLVKNAFVLACNVSLEYEKTEVNAGFFYKSAEEREKLVSAERQFIENRVKKIIELKRKVCDTPDKNFVVINQQGIDPQSLDLLAKEGIVALRRAKRRNMERYVERKHLGHAHRSPVANAECVSTPIAAPTPAGCVIPGAGAFELAAHAALVSMRPNVKGKAQLGVQAYADALLVIVKTLATNSGLDPQDVLVKLQQEQRLAKQPIGLNLATGSTREFT